MKKKDYISKPATSQRVSADRQTALGQAALAKLGNALSGRGAGSADSKAGRGAARVRALQIAVQTARGGGQGKSAPKSAPKPKSNWEKFRDSKVADKMTPAQREKSFRKNTPKGGRPGKK